MPPAKAPESRQTLDPERVARWLARHPDFFIGREGLLQQLKVPHPESHGAISLLERLVIDLRERAEGAEWRLEQLLESARYNESQYRRTRELVLALLEAEDSDALGEALATQLAERFQTQAVALWCAPELTDIERQRLLPHSEPPKQAGSCALTRLTLGEPIGYLILASHDGDYFRASLDTLFTEYLGEVVARLMMRHAGRL